MTTSRSSRKTTASELTELHQTLERLIDRMQCLTDAVDELRQEMGWRNNNTSLERPLPSRVMITSMARDPVADELLINAVPQDVIEQFRREAVSDTVATDVSTASPGTQATLFE